MLKNPALLVLIIALAFLVMAAFPLPGRINMPPPAPESISIPPRAAAPTSQPNSIATTSQSAVVSQQPTSTQATGSLGACASMVPPGWNDASNIESSTLIKGWNAFILPLVDFKVSGYCFLYPDTWTPFVVGAGTTNILMTTNNSSSPYNGDSIDSTTDNQILFIQAAQGYLPIEKSDQSVYSGDSGAAPLIGPNEAVIRKEVQTIGGKQALFELSENGTTTIDRYFLEDAGGVYMFQSTIDKSLVNSASYLQFLSTMDQIVSSTRFIR